MDTTTLPPFPPGTTRLTLRTNIFSSIDFAYDDAGQVIWEGDEIAGSGGRTQTNYYRYPNGSVAHLHYPGGTFRRSDYTSRGQLAATGWDDDDNNWWRKLAAYTYLADGKVGQIDFGNGMRTGPLAPAGPSWMWPAVEGATSPEKRNEMQAMLLSASTKRTAVPVPGDALGGFSPGAFRPATVARSPLTFSETCTLNVEPHQLSCSLKGAVAKPITW